MPLRPRASMAPTAASECHASLTVVGDTPSCVASSRTVGRRVPTGSSPAVIMRPMTPAMRRALRASLPPPGVVGDPRDDVIQHHATGLCEAFVNAMYGHNGSIVQHSV